MDAVLNEAKAGATLDEQVQYERRFVAQIKNISDQTRIYTLLLTVEKIGPLIKLYRESRQTRELSDDTELFSIRRATGFS